VYKVAGDSWAQIEEMLKGLPDRVANSRLEELPKELQGVLDAATLATIQEEQNGLRRDSWNKAVHDYVAGLRSLNLIILPESERKADDKRTILVNGVEKPTNATLSLDMVDSLSKQFLRQAQDNFFNKPTLQPKIVKLTIDKLQATHVVDESATTTAKNLAEERVPPSEGRVLKPANQKLVEKGEVSVEDWKLLMAENAEFNRILGDSAWGRRLGLLGVVAVLTVAMSAYVVRYQPRVLRNSARAVAIVALLLSMLLLAQLAGVGSSPMYIFGLAPTLLVGMILAIAYDQRSAIGLAGIHAILVTLALNEGLGFFMILATGVGTACFLLDDIRTRSKLIEVGGATAIAMIAATFAVGLLSFDPLPHIARNCLYSGAAGLAVGFVVLGILPFIERAFRITTSMTLLELADVSHPLLRRLSMEAPGTYNHSLQVATLAEEASEAIGANALLCRVASYYHDIGKINKADYFIENQVNGHNRHINLSPSVSLLIIIGHVKDGVELAKEYNLPTSILPFIQQHHGTTLVEFFYHRACTQQEQQQEQQPAISETQYRYPGPKPRTKETAIVMMADAVESATRAMTEPNAGRIETLVHELTQKRLLDGQFDDCDLTLKDLAEVKKTLIRTLLGMYHGRIAYPTLKKAGKQGPATVQSGHAAGAARTA
jgi:hypothetical protein